MPTLYLDQGEDFALSSSGGLKLADGWEEIRQRILRRLHTNPQSVLDDRSLVAADYYFHPDYGAGLPRKVGAKMSKEFLFELHRIIMEGTVIDQGIDVTIPPTVKVLRKQLGILHILIQVHLSNNTRKSLAFELPVSG